MNDMSRMFRVVVALFREKGMKCVPVIQVVSAMVTISIFGIHIVLMKSRFNL